MLNRGRYRRYLFFCGFVLFLLILPPLFVESLRIRLIRAITPFVHFASHTPPSLEQKKLEIENLYLRQELQKLRGVLEQKSVCDNLHFQCIPAKVIYRDPSQWSSILWVDVGEETNNQLGKEGGIAIHSPVILGRGVVGAIDYVGKKQSRVRLITDVGLKPAVRAVRGLIQEQLLGENINQVLSYLERKKEIPLPADKKKILIDELSQLKKALPWEAANWYLAKGILEGGSTPLWRSASHRLKGVGFNYDFPDKEGPARELLTGKPMEDNPKFPPMPLLKEGDLLVTTGMDGIFPGGLLVAEIKTICPVEEGACTFELEAVPFVRELDTLQRVFILPPLGYDPQDMPRF